MKVTISAKTGGGKIAVKDLKAGQMFRYYAAALNELKHYDIIFIANYSYESGVDKIAVSLSTGEGREIFGEWMIDQKDLLTDVSISFEP